MINGFRCCGLVPFNPNAVDYIKCLGRLNNNSGTDVLHIQQQTQQTETSSSNVITLAKFKEIVAPSTMSKLNTYGNSPDVNENLNILYRLYSVFDVNSPQPASAQNVPTNYKENIATVCIEPPLTVQSNEDIEMNNEIRCDEHVTNEEILNMHEMNEVNDVLSVFSNNDNLNDDPPISEIVPESPKYMTPAKKVVSSCKVST